MPKKKYRILGIDTSLRSSGIGVIEVNGSNLSLIFCGRIYNRSTETHSVCLKNIYNDLTDCIKKYNPGFVAVEGTFFSKNAKTAMILGQARGAAISACAQFDIPIAEHSPRTIKQAVTGNGSSQKDQVAKMVMRLLGINEQPQEDAADALAIAICHYHQLSLPEPLRSPNI